MRFLIIDDSITMRRIIANILVRLGFPDAVHAANGREALDRIASEQVDVVITDWYMPEMNGLDFVKSLRTDPATNHIPIIIVTANAASDDIQHALELGVNGYILKPFTVETMRDKISALCEQLGVAPPGDPHKAPVAASAPAPVAVATPAVAAAPPAVSGAAASPVPGETTPAEVDAAMAAAAAAVGAADGAEGADGPAESESRVEAAPLPPASAGSAADAVDPEDDEDADLDSDATPASAPHEETAAVT